MLSCAHVGRWVILRKPMRHSKLDELVKDDIYHGGTPWRGTGKTGGMRINGVSPYFCCQAAPILGVTSEDKQKC